MANILLAEDDRSVREFVIRALRHQGHRITAVDDGGQALEALGRQSFDLLLADILMPGTDGIALAFKAAEDRPGLPILLMTGYAGEAQRAQALKAPIHRVVCKPFSLRQICEVVAETLAADG